MLRVPLCAMPSSPVGRVPREAANLTSGDSDKMSALKQDVSLIQVIDDAFHVRPYLGPLETLE
jgi:hypothetical protein